VYGRFADASRWLSVNRIPDVISTFVRRPPPRNTPSTYRLMVRMFHVCEHILPFAAFDSLVDHTPVKDPSDRSLHFTQSKALPFLFPPPRGTVTSCGHRIVYHDDDTCCSRSPRLPVSLYVYPEYLFFFSYIPLLFVVLMSNPGLSVSFFMFVLFQVRSYCITIRKCPSFFTVLRFASYYCTFKIGHNCLAIRCMIWFPLFLLLTGTFGRSVI